MLMRILADAAIIQLALVASLAVRLALLLVTSADEAVFRNELDDHFRAYFTNAWPLTGVCIAVFFLFGFYTYGRFYQGRYKVVAIAQAVSLAYLLFAFFTYFFHQDLFSRPAFLLSWFFSMVLLIGARVWNHLWQHIVNPERDQLAPKHHGGPSRVLVIGGAGYIGSALLPKLLARGYQVRVLDMLIYGRDAIGPLIDHPNLELVEGDFRHVQRVLECMQHVDAIVHLGAIVGDPACSINEDLTIDVNLSATLMIAELAKRQQISRLVFASTCSVYGACDETLDERSLVKPISLYGHTKLASEKVLHNLIDDVFQPSIVRFATIYGLSGRTRFDLVVNLLAAKAKLDGEITVFGGDQWRPFVHVDDAALAVATILEAPLALVGGQIYNVGSNEQNYTIRQIGEMVHQCVPDAKLAINDQDTDKRNYRVDFSKIRNELNFTPQWTVEQGIQQVLDAIANGEITDYRDPVYSNVKFLSTEGTSRLARDQWARELINDISNQ